MQKIKFKLTLFNLIIIIVSILIMIFGILSCKNETKSELIDLISRGHNPKIIYGRYYTSLDAKWYLMLRINGTYEAELPETPFIGYWEYEFDGNIIHMFNQHNPEGKGFEPENSFTVLESEEDSIKLITLQGEILNLYGQ